MSLVVAKQNGINCFIVCDTRLTSPFAERLSPKEGVLKVVIISPKICLAFAGDLEVANQALAEISSKIQHILNDDLLKILKKFHLESNRATDFIVGFADKEPKLYLVKEGDIFQTQNAWVGIPEAFELFQERFHKPETMREEYLNGRVMLNIMKIPDNAGEDGEVFARMKKALTSVIEDRRVETVGDFAVILAIENLEWKYFPYCDSLTHEIEWEKILPPDGTWVTAPAGTAAEGGCGFNFIPCSGKNGAGAAVYFYQGNFGFLFPGGNQFPRPFLVGPALVPIDFEEKVFVDYGIELKTMFSQASQYAARGWKKFRTGDQPGAAADMDKAVSAEPLNPAIRCSRALFYSESFEAEKADQEIDQAFKIDTNLPEAFHTRGIIKFNRGNFLGAAADFLKTLELKPDHPDASKNLVVAENRVTKV